MSRDCLVQRSESLVGRNVRAEGKPDVRVSDQLLVCNLPMRPQLATFQPNHILQGNKWGPTKAVIIQKTPALASSQHITVMLAPITQFRHATVSKL